MRRRAPSPRPPTPFRGRGRTAYGLLVPLLWPFPVPEKGHNGNTAAQGEAHPVRLRAVPGTPGYLENVHTALPYVFARCVCTAVSVVQAMKMSSSVMSFTITRSAPRRSSAAALAG